MSMPPKELAYEPREMYGVAQATRERKPDLGEHRRDRLVAQPSGRSSVSRQSYGAERWTPPGGRVESFARTQPAHWRNRGSGQHFGGRARF